MTKDLKMAMVEDLMRVHDNAIDREFDHSCDIHFKIITDNVIPAHIGFLGIAYEYTLKKV